MNCTFSKRDGASIHGISDSVPKVYGVDVDHCEVFVNDEKATLDDLRPGDELSLSGQPAVTIKATRKVLESSPATPHDAAREGFHAGDRPATAADKARAAQAKADADKAKAAQDVAKGRKEHS